jgi:hypothetical protein
MGLHRNRHSANAVSGRPPEAPASKPCLDNVGITSDGIRERFIEFECVQAEFATGDDGEMIDHAAAQDRPLVLAHESRMATCAPVRERFIRMQEWAFSTAIS